MKHAPIRIGSGEEPVTPVDVKAYTPSKPVAEMSDEEFGDWLCTVPPCPGIRHVDDVDAEEDARIEAEIAAGRGIPHELVREWLMTVGTPEYKPMPREWLE